MKPTANIITIPILEMEELAGVTFVRSLQKMKGIEESFESALAGWRKMTPAQREKTKQAFLFFERSKN